MRSSFGERRQGRGDEARLPSRVQPDVSRSFREHAMNSGAHPQIHCADFLRDNRHLYAHKALRKKIAMIHVDAANPGSTRIRIDLGAAMLVVGGQAHKAEAPAAIVRKLSEFTWDFVIYSILDFHPVLVVVDAVLFLSGPLYNRRLRKQLHLLADDERVLQAGERMQALIGFRGVSKGAAQLQLPICPADGERHTMTFDIS